MMQSRQDAPPGWQRHETARDVWYSEEGSRAAHPELPARVCLEYLQTFYLSPAPAATESGAPADAVAYLVACALHAPLVLVCLRSLALHGGSDAEVAASSHLPAARAAWRAVEGARGSTAAASARLTADARARAAAQAAAARLAAEVEARRVAEAEARSAFSCPVCLEQRPASARVALPACGDALCRGCLLEALGVQLQQHPRALRLACPFGVSCAAALEPSLPLLGFEEGALAALVHQGSDVLQRRWALARNPTLLPCPVPRCEAGYARRPTRAQAWVAQCMFCQERFCGLHGLRHALPPLPAGAWRALLDAADIEAALAACAAHAALEAAPAPPEPSALVGTVPCPGCLMPTYREYGCDHMRCTLCETQWCWACGGLRQDFGHACLARVLAPAGARPPRGPPPGPRPAAAAAAAALPEELAAPAPPPPAPPAATVTCAPCGRPGRGAWLPRRVRALGWRALPAVVVLSLPLLALQLAVCAVLLLLHAPRLLLSTLAWGLGRCLRGRACARLQPRESPREALADSLSWARGASLDAAQAAAGLLAALASLGFRCLRGSLYSCLTACLWQRRLPELPLPGRGPVAQRLLRPLQQLPVEVDNVAALAAGRGGAGLPLPVERLTDLPLPPRIYYERNRITRAGWGGWEDQW